MLLCIGIFKNYPLMNINFDKNREVMIENQLRPNKITNIAILDIFNKVSKENFISEDKLNICYSDQDITVKDSRGYLKNLHLAQILNFSEIQNDDKVLHIGGLTGYLSVLISKLCKELIVIERNNDLAKILKNNIAQLNIDNIKIVNNDFKEGFAQDSPYDIIIIDNPIMKLSNSLKEQVDKNNGTIIMIKKINNDLCKAMRIIKNNDDYIQQYLFDVFTKYELFREKEKFIF